MSLFTLHDELALELAAAYLALDEVKANLAAKDSIANRQAVLDMYEAIDALLDMLNESREASA